MPEMVVIDPQLVKDKTSMAQRQLKSTRFDLYATIAQRDSRSGSGVLSLEGSIAVNSLEHMLGASAAFKATIQRNGLLQGSYKTKDEFVDLFSLFAGAVAGSALIERMKSVREVSLPCRHAIDFSRGEYLVLEDLVQTYLKGTAHATNGELLLGLTKDFTSWIISEAVRQKADPRFSELVRQAEAAHVRLDGILINGFQHRSFEKADVTPARYKREDYVGNQELLETLGSAITELFDYDFKTKKNPNLELGGFTQTLTVWGEGGMGKSMGIALALSEAKDAANAQGIPFFLRELRGFKSEYFAKSAQNIREIFADIQKGDAVYALVAEDIDTIFFAREELKNRPEDKDILGELMNQLEGLTSNTLGNYLFIATSNHPLQGDGPLMDRLRQCQIHVTGPQTPHDYAAVFKAKLRDGIAAGTVAVKDWAAIGGAAREHRLSNRDIRNICLTAVARAKNGGRPEHFYSLSYDERLEYLRNQRTPIADCELRSAITAYVRGLAEQRAKEYEAAIARELQARQFMDDVAKRMRDHAH
jgi:hypothetical protein